MVLPLDTPEKKEVTMTIENPEQYWNDLVQVLVGKTVRAVRYLNKSECESEFSDWYSVPVVIEFTDGTYIIPMRDDEGNDGGALLSNLPDLGTIPVLPPSVLR